MSGDKHGHKTGSLDFVPLRRVMATNEHRSTKISAKKQQIPYIIQEIILKPPVFMKLAVYAGPALLAMMFISKLRTLK